MLGNIAYKNYNKKNDIHGTVLYPAVMVAPIQNRILEKLICENNINKVFDGFHGSGTSLYEAMTISDKVNLIGCDINPLANLITKVKLQGVDNNIEDDLLELKQNIYTYNDCEIHSFNNIDKWFRKDIISSLSQIRNAIIKINNEKNRLYFWYIFSDIVRKYSNTRSSTYKLHAKKNNTILGVVDNSISDYINSAYRNFTKFNRSCTNFQLYKKDILKFLPGVQDDYFDITITSPPYGDNATTVPYGQFSMLPLYWIDPNDLELEGWELENYSIIDNKSLGGKNNQISFTEFENQLLKEYSRKISSRKLNKVYSFFYDYFNFIKEVSRTTTQYIVMTLGNRTVDGINIDLTNITKIYLNFLGFKNLETASRIIPNKRIPIKTSKVANSSVSSINEEFVIVHKKI